jgi:hypothetical protein
LEKEDISLPVKLNSKKATSTPNPWNQKYISASELWSTIRKGDRTTSIVLFTPLQYLSEILFSSPFLDYKKVESMMIGVQASA